MKKWIVFITGLIVALSLVAAITGCGEEETKPEERTELILATTTSTQDSGLLDEWVPMFEEENPYVVKVIAVGSGAAKRMSMRLAANSGRTRSIASSSAC